MRQKIRQACVSLLQYFSKRAPMVRLSTKMFRLMITIARYMLAPQTKAYRLNVVSIGSVKVLFTTLALYGLNGSLLPMLKWLDPPLWSHIPLVMLELQTFVLHNNNPITTLQTAAWIYLLRLPSQGRRLQVHSIRPPWVAINNHCRTSDRSVWPRGQRPCLDWSVMGVITA